MPPAAEVVGVYGSSSKPGVEYLVKRHADGVLSCSCPKWRFSKAPKACRHTNRVRDGLDDDTAIQAKRARAARVLDALKQADLVVRSVGLQQLTQAIVRIRDGEAGVRSPLLADEDNALRLMAALEHAGLLVPPAPDEPRRVGGQHRRVIVLDDED